MKAFGVSARERRTILLGASLVLLIVGAGRGVPAWRSWHTAVVDSAQKALAEVQDAESDVDQLKSTLDTLQLRKKRFLDYAPKLVVAGSPATASAALGALLTRIADGNGVQVASVRTSADTGVAQIRKVSAEMEALTDIRGLTALLRIIESGEPLLSVAELSIEQTEAAAPEDRQESLRVRLRVQGLFLGSAKASR